MFPARKVFPLTAHLLFWGWNGLFIILVVFGLVPEVLADVLRASWHGIVPPSYGAMAMVLVGVPPLSVGLGVWKLRADPGRLLTLLVAVEWPLIVWALVRTFGLQELNPGVQWTLTTASLGAVGLVWKLVRGAAPSHTAVHVAQTALLSLQLLAGLWWSLVVILVGFPLAMHALFEAPLAIDSALAVVGGLLRWMTIVLVLTLPLIVLGASVQAFRLASRPLSPPKRWAVAGLAATTSVVGIGVASRPMVPAAFALSTNPKEAIQSAEIVRTGLVDAYLARARYIDTIEFADDIGDLWDTWVAKGLGPVVVPIARVVGHPFLYSGVAEGRSWSVFAEDAATAAARYAAVFDTPITRGEQARIVAAQKNQWRWQDALSGAIDAGQTRVWLERQDIVATEMNGVAAVTIHDVYRNLTFEDREVVVYFYLPDGAVATGLALGPTEDRSLAFSSVVSPRGAAQQIYREETQKRIDPALLEQVGPGQYRLRVFPVPARNTDDLDILTDEPYGPPLHVWLDLTLLATPTADGSATWPWPKVSEIRNLFWTDASVRTVQGQAVAPTTPWPAPLPAPRTVTPEIAGGLHTPDPVSVRRTFVPPAPPPRGWPANTVLVIDRTHSMEPYTSEVVKYIQDIPRTALLCATPTGITQCESTSAGQWQYYGRRSIDQVLVDLTQSPLLADADRVVVLTDSSIGSDPEDVPRSSERLPPLALVVLGGLPSVFSDATQDILTRPGSALTDNWSDGLRWASDRPIGGWNTEVVARQPMLASPEPNTETSLAGEMSETPARPRDEGVQEPPNPLVLPLLAHAWVRTQMSQSAEDLTALDQLHHVAVATSVVTPVSSLLVLVSAEQHARLRQLAEADDRFEREVETEIASFGLSSAPEPAEWVLMGLGGLATLLRRRRRYQPSPDCQG